MFGDVTKAFWEENTINLLHTPKPNVFIGKRMQDTQIHKEWQRNRSGIIGNREPIIRQGTPDISERQKKQREMLGTDCPLVWSGNSQFSDTLTDFIAPEMWQKKFLFSKKLDIIYSTTPIFCYSFSTYIITIWCTQDVGKTHLSSSQRLILSWHWLSLGTAKPPTC